MLRKSNKDRQLRHQSQKTYCAAFCASLALLAGSGNNTGYNGTAMMERMAD